MSTISSVQSIPLHQLILSPSNVRQVPATAAEDAELKASIQAQGILQNLLVHPSLEHASIFCVHAGGRRLKALQDLAAERVIASDHAVPCMIAAPESALETSLAENKARAAMHPADEFAAMAALIDTGESVGRVATRFGVSERQVRQRLRLGKLAPEILAAFRAGHVTLEIVTAFTLGADVEAQSVVWQQAKDESYLSAHRVRRLLTERAIELDSDLGLFVGIEAYERAGGAITRDLFSEEDEGFMDDAALVRRLAIEKLETKAAELRKEWAWATADLDPEYGFTAQYDRVEPQPAEFSDEVNGELRAIEHRQSELDELSEDEWDETLAAEVDRIGERYDFLIETSEAERRHLPEDHARAGCVVTIGEDGEFQIYAGLIERSTSAGDAAADGSGKTEFQQDDQGHEPSPPSPEQVARKECGYSQSLIDDLKAHRQQITRAHLAGNFGVAFDLALYAMCVDLFNRRTRRGSLSLRASETYVRSSLNDLERTPADRLLEAHKRRLERTWLSLSDSQRFTALTALPEDDKQRLFAWCIAATLEPQLGFEDASDAALELGGGHLAIPFAEYWRPTAANYWGRVKKAHALDVASDVLGPRWAKDHADDKKATLAAALEAAFDTVKQSGAIGLDPAARAKAAAWLPTGMPYVGVSDRGDPERDRADDAEESEEEAEVTADDTSDLPAFLMEEEVAA